MINDLINYYNSLDGKKIDRNSLKEFSNRLLAHKKLKYVEEIRNRVQKILKSNNADYFEIEIENKIDTQGMGAARHTGLEKEALDECGRLKKGYRYVNGKVVKSEPVKKQKFIVVSMQNGEGYSEPIIKKFNSSPAARNFINSEITSFTKSNWEIKKEGKNVTSLISENGEDEATIWLLKSKDDFTLLKLQPTINKVEKILSSNKKAQLILKLESEIDADGNYGTEEYEEWEENKDEPFAIHFDDYFYHYEIIGVKEPAKKTKPKDTPKPKSKDEFIYLEEEYGNIQEFKNQMSSALKKDWIKFENELEDIDYKRLNFWQDKFKQYSLFFDFGLDAQPYDFKIKRKKNTKPKATTKAKPKKQSFSNIKDKEITQWKYSWGDWNAQINKHPSRKEYKWDVFDKYGNDTYDFTNDIDVELETPLEAENNMFRVILDRIGHTPNRQIANTSYEKPTNSKDEEIKNKLLRIKNKFGLKSYLPTITKGLAGTFLADGISIFNDEDRINYGEEALELDGLNAAAKDVESKINDFILSKIKNGDNLPVWKQTWATKSNVLAQNFVTKTPYSGTNSVLLNTILGSTMKTPYYLTFNQIKKLEGTVKKGAKSIPLIYYNFSYRLKNLSSNPALENKLLSKVRGYVIKIGKKSVKISDKNYMNMSLTERDIKILNLEQNEYFSYAFKNYFNVFNVSDTEGIEYELPTPKENTPKEKIDKAESIVNSFKDIPKIQFHDSEASYTPNKDIINMPPIEIFDNSEEYYSTLFHELIHSTIHKSRLNREEKFKGKEKNVVYAFEELIAELGASYLCGLAGILESTHLNQASYLKGWYKRLKDATESDTDFFVFATRECQKAVDYIIKDWQWEDKEKAPKKEDPSATEKAKVRARAKALKLKLKLKEI